MSKLELLVKACYSRTCLVTVLISIVLKAIYYLCQSLLSRVRLWHAFQSNSLAIMAICNESRCWFSDRYIDDLCTQPSWNQQSLTHLKQRALLNHKPDVNNDVLISLCISRDVIESVHNKIAQLLSWAHETTG